jgi:hypothetical protein
MAYALPQLTDEERQKQLQQQSEAAPTGSGAPAGGGAAPGAGDASGQAAPSRPASSGFVNLDDYVKANDNTASSMADGLYSKADSQAAEASSNLTQLRQQYADQAHGGTLSFSAPQQPARTPRPVEGPDAPQRRLTPYSPGDRSSGPAQKPTAAGYFDDTGATTPHSYAPFFENHQETPSYAKATSATGTVPAPGQPADSVPETPDAPAPAPYSYSTPRQPDNLGGIMDPTGLYPGLHNGFVTGAEGQANDVVNGTYGGPHNLTQVDGYGDLFSKTRAATQAVGALGSESGRIGALQQQYGQQGGYTGGMANLDAALLGQADGGRLAQLQDHWGNLGSNLDAATGDTSPSDEAIAQTQDAQAAASDYLRRGVDYNNAEAARLNTDKQQLQREQERQFSDAQAAYAKFARQNHGQLHNPISFEEWAKLPENAIYSWDPHTYVGFMDNGGKTPARK